MTPKNAVIGKCVIWPTEPAKPRKRTGLRCSLRLENAAEQLWHKRRWHKRLCRSSSRTIELEMLSRETKKLEERVRNDDPQDFR
jgi:hypothetical protein